jgi:hypothetical protein
MKSQKRAPLFGLTAGPDADAAVPAGAICGPQHRSSGKVQGVFDLRAEFPL